MASPTPGGSTKESWHRITSIKLEPSIATRAITLKILVDGQVAHRLPGIPPGASLSWDSVPSCNVASDSHMEIRVYEKHMFGVERIGTMRYAVSEVVGLSDTILNPDAARFKAVLSFPTSETAEEALATGLEDTKKIETKPRLLERLGPTRDMLKAILDAGVMVSELHPAAKVVVGFCQKAWQALENQEQCDASVEKLIVGLTKMLPFVDQIEKAAKLPQLQNTLEEMKELIRVATEFVIEYKSQDGF
ncbi:hypothetical protein BDV93DRAFT_549565, partial [Ceratobasidium sp. AG-I]